MDEDTPLVAAVKMPKRLPVGRRLAYGVGHVLNDLCASIWFSYLLLYFHKVLSFSNAMAGGLLLLGQVTDGICTPLIGYESDRTKRGICNYGRRKTWHLVGTLCVMCTFAFIFQPVFGDMKVEDWARFMYYAPFIIIFQFGWAATQISHLSLIPEISHGEEERVELNAIRYAFTVMSSIVVYMITFLLLRFHNLSDPGPQSASSTLDPSDVPQFRTLVLTVVAIGAIFSLIFHLGTKEPKKLRSDAHCSQGAGLEEGQEGYGSVQVMDDRPRLRMKWSDWFLEPQFFQVTALYMFTRIMVNIAQIYLPMYVTDTLDLDKETVALAPLVVYISGFLAALVAKPINRLSGRKLTYFLGAVLYLGSCVWMAIPNIGLQVYGAAILLGAGGSTVLVTSLALAADLIGPNTESGAFVFGAMSFTDKLSNGLAVEVIQLLQPCVYCCPGCKAYYKAVMTYVTGGAAICAIIVLATLIPVTIGKRRKQYCEVPSVEESPHPQKDSLPNPQSSCGAAAPHVTSEERMQNGVGPRRELRACAAEIHNGSHHRDETGDRHGNSPSVDPGDDHLGDCPTLHLDEEKIDGGNDLEVDEQTSPRDSDEAASHEVRT